MYRAGLTVFLLLAMTIRISFSQGDCASPTHSGLESVIASIIQGEDTSGTAAVIELMDFQVVCRAFSARQGFLRAVSVVVQYSCSGNANCPSGTVTEQIETECEDGRWDNSVNGIRDHIRSMTTEASLTTATRDDCIVCISPEINEAEDFRLDTDSVTHCVGE